MRATSASEGAANAACVAGERNNAPVVVKVGTSSVTDEGGVIDQSAVKKLAAEVAALRAGGHDVIVVSSGAVAAGVAALGLERRPTDIATLQAIAAAGQARLMRSWDDALADHGLVPAQALLVPHDFVDRRQYLHARRTLTRLLALGAVPIVNENDAIASDEIRYGDNDRLAALVSHNMGAALLVLLTDLDGLYTADPRHDPGAELIREVSVDNPLLSIAAGHGGSGRGSGGMASKLEAARIASWSGVPTVIANAARAGVLSRGGSRRAGGHAIRGAAAQPHGAQAVDRLRRPHRRSDHRRRWRAAGRSSSARSRCYPPASCPSKAGSWTVTRSRCADTDGIAFARGMVFVDAAQLRKVKGMQTRDLPEGVVHEVIHRDDLVVLPA